MLINLNNRKETFSKDGLTVQEIIELKNFTFKLLVTKLNGKPVKKEDRAKTIVKHGDDLAVIHLVSGG